MKLLAYIFFIKPAVAASSAINGFINSAANTAGQSGLVQPGYDNSPELLIGKYINNLLNFLGIAFIVLIIYGGILWMTAAGNEQRVEKAKKIIINSTIGLAIILLSKMISLFIVEILTPI